MVHCYCFLLQSKSMNIIHRNIIFIEWSHCFRTLQILIMINITQYS